MCSRSTVSVRSPPSPRPAVQKRVSVDPSRSLLVALPVRPGLLPGVLPGDLPVLSRDRRDAMWKSGLLLLLAGHLVSCELQPDPGITPPPGRPPPPGRQPRERLDFGSVPAGVYETLAHYEPGPIGILFSLVHAFLCVVQPNPFPQDLIVKLVKEKFGAPQTEYQKVLYYELGFLLCAAVGVVYLVLLPLAGLLLCICRCCDNCGGEMHQRQRKNADCQRGLLGTLLFTTSLVISEDPLTTHPHGET
ncbi:unnamed protein product [Boreogadus saida]